MPTPLSNVLIVLGITAAAVEDGILYGLAPFILALANEVVRLVVVAAPEDELT